MRQMKDSGIAWVGEIPQEWQSVRSKFIIQSNDGGVWGGEPTDTDLDKIVLRSTEQTIEGKWKITSPAYRNLSTVAYKNCLIRPNDLLITKSSGSALHIGKTSLAGLEFANYEYYYSNFLQRIRVNKKYAPKYAWYIFNSTFVRVQFAFLQNATSGLGNINSEDIESVYIPLPPIDEQKRIVNYLDRECEKIDGLKADIQAQIDTLEQYKRSVITEVVTHGLNPDVPKKDSGILWVGNIPQDWKVMPIYCLYSERKNINTLGKENNLLSLSYGKLIRKDINTSDGLLPNNYNGYNIVECDDIIIRPTDLQNDKRSLRTGLAKERGIITSAYITLKPQQSVNSKYFHYLLHSYDIKKVFYNMGNGVRQGLNYDEFAKLMVIVPPLDEQQAIAEYLDHKCAEIEQIIADKKAQLETLDNYKKSLIYEYVTGKQEVPINEL